jgi:hypothetical protein
VTFTVIGKAEAGNAGVCELGREYSNAHEAWAASGRMVRDGCQDIKIIFAARVVMGFLNCGTPSIISVRAVSCGDTRFKPL